MTRICRRRQRGHDDHFANTTASSKGDSPDRTTPLAFLRCDHVVEPRLPVRTDPLAFLDDPDQMQLLRINPDLAGSAADEMILWSSPIINFRRTGAGDFELHGVAIQENDPVALYYFSATSRPITAAPVPRTPAFRYHPIAQSSRVFRWRRPAPLPRDPPGAT
jgi:hypothetical protein